MKLKRAICILLVFLSICTLFTGCGETLEQKKYIIRKTTNAIPNIEFVNVVTTKDEEGNNVNTYTFKNKDFEFQVKNYLIESNQLFEDYQSITNTSYITNLLSFKKDNIIDLFSKYNIEIWDASMKEDYDTHSNDLDSFRKYKEENPVLICYVGRKLATKWDSDVDFQFYVTNYDDIRVVYDFLTDFKQEMSEYFLRDYHYNCPDIEVEIYCQNQTGKNNVLVETLLFEDRWYFVESEFVLDGKLEEIQHLYKLLVQEGKVVDNNLDISGIKPSNINKIFVNDILFDIDATSLNELKHSGFTNQEIINIVYFAQEDKYYIEVGFGIPKNKKSTSMDNVQDDYIQRDIIMQSYPGCDYKVKGKTTTYNINGDEFKITRKTNGNNETIGMKFYKNGKELDIKQLKEVSNFHRKYYTMFISVDDFVQLLNLEISKYDYENAVIYFKTIK